MTSAGLPGRGTPVLLVKWYDFTRWLLARIDSFPKNQRFVFGTRLADHAVLLARVIGELELKSTNHPPISLALPSPVIIGWVRKFVVRRFRQIVQAAQLNFPTIDLLTMNLPAYRLQSACLCCAEVRPLVWLRQLRIGSPAARTGRTDMSRFWLQAYSDIVAKFLY